MKLNEKVILKRIKANLNKCMALLLVLIYVLSMVPLTANASNEEPQLGANDNIAEYMTVTNNDVDCTADYRNTKEINVISNTRGSFGNIKHTGNVYYYSADICVENDTSSYGSIRMILGTCTYSAYKRYIEVCIRPNLDGQAVIFLNGHGFNTSGEYAVNVVGPTDIKVGDTYRCTAKYDNGTISFWVNSTLIFDSVPLPAKTKKVTPSVGFYSQNCNGKISDVKIWGDVEKIEDINIDETVKPVFDAEKDINLISNVLITDSVNGKTYKCSDNEVKSESTATNRPVFSNIIWNNNTYNLSFDAVKYDTDEKDWEGLIFKVATAQKDGEEYDVELRIRLNGAILFISNTKGENPAQIINCSSPYGVTNTYTVHYNDNNKIYLWKDDTSIFKGLDLTKYGYTDIKPAISLGGEVCAFDYTDIKLWGEGVSVMYEPEFDENTDINAIHDVGIAGNIAGTTFVSKECTIKNDANTTSRLSFTGVTYDKVYNFSTKAVIHDNKDLTANGDEFSWEGLIFNVGKAKKDDADYKIEVRVRNGGIHVFAVKDGGGEEVLDSFYGFKTDFETEYKYTLVFNEDGSFDFWQNGASVIYGYKVKEKNFQEFTPEFGLGGEVCSFDFKEMKLWGKGLTVTKEPEKIEPQFNEATDINAIPDAGIEGSLGGTTFVSKDCIIKNDANTTTRLTFTGVTYDKVYNFSTKAVMYDNKNLTANGDEFNWEGLIFSVGKAKKEDTDYNIEVRVRKSGIHIFAVKNGGGEELLDSVYGIPTAFGEEIKYTVVFNEDGSFDFWHNGAPVFYGYKVKEKSFEELTPAFGLGGEVCSFEFKEMKLWGKGMTVTKEPEKIEPKFNKKTDTNVIPDAGIEGSIGGTTFVSKKCLIKNDANTTTRLTFTGVTYDKVYNFSTKAVMYDNKNLTANGDEFSWEGLIFQIGKTKKGTEDYKIEVRVRNGGIHIFAVKNGGGEELLDSVYGIPTAFDEEVEYTVVFNKDGSFDFWHNGTPIFYGFKVKEKNFKKLTPEFGLGGEVCSFDFKEMKLWGKGITVTKEPEKIEPKFNKKSDTNIIPDVVVSNNTSGTSSRPENYAVSSKLNTTARLVLSGITYGKSYYFSTKAVMYDNKTTIANGDEVGWEGLIFQIGKAKKGTEDYKIEVRVRNGGIHIFVVKNGGGEELLDSVYGIPTAFGEEIKYTLVFNEDGSFDFWHNGAPVIYGYQIKEKKFKALTPELGLGGEVCSFDFKAMKLWGDVTVLTAPEFDSATMEDLIPNVVVNDIFSGKLYKLTDRNFKNTTQNTGRINFSGVKVSGDYTFFAEVGFKDNKGRLSNGAEIDWEGIIFRAAKAQKNKKSYVIEVRVRHKNILVYAVDDDNQETLLLNQGLVTEYNQSLPYVLEYKTGKITLWRDGIKILDNFRPADLGYTDVSAFMGIGCEVCNFEFSDMHLVNKYAQKDRTLPQKPESNGDYGTVTEVQENSVISFNNGTLSCLDDKNAAKVFFQYLPFGVNDTYVFGCNVKVTKAEKDWMGPRFIFGKNSKGEEIALFFTKGNLLVVEGTKQIYSLKFSREQGATYRFDMLIEPSSISLWVNDILLIDNVKTSPKTEAMTGVLFENTVSQISNISMYYTSPVKFFVPKKKPKPVLKTLSPNQYNAAEFAKVTLDGKDFNGYFDSKLISNNNENGLKYMFKDLPIKDSQSYYYSSTFNVSLSEANWKGPRFIYRKGANATMYCAITQTAILLLADGAVVGSSPFELEIGRSYDIVIYSTPDSVSVWIDGNIVFSNVDLSKYTANDTLKATPGILFELCKAQVTNIALYGDDIVFDPEFVDLELYNDKFFRIKNVPQNPNSSKNLFTNITMVDLSEGSLGAEYDDENRVFKNDYSDVFNGKIRFVDANKSSNLNGLKNSSGYVFNFKYKANKTGSEKKEENGVWFISNSSTAPYLSTNCDVRIGIFEDSLRLYIYKDGQLLSSNETEFDCVIGREYDINVVHGKNWIKLYVDGKLVLVSRDLPEYKVAFDFEICNTACNISNFELYEFEDTGLEILETAQEVTTTKAGKSVIKTESYDIKSDFSFPVIWVAVLAVLLIASGLGGVLIIRSAKRSSKK